MKRKTKQAERRRFSRRPIKEAVEVKVPRWDSWEKVGLSDLGRGGMGFVTRHPLDLGDPIQVRVRWGTGRGLRGAEVVTGRVAWVRPHSFYHMGAVFDALDIQRHQRLLQATPLGRTGPQPKQSDRQIWKGWIGELLKDGTLQRRDLLELAGKVRKGSAR